jgi:hypothetical protein
MFFGENMINFKGYGGMNLWKAAILAPLHFHLQSPDLGVQLVLVDVALALAPTFFTIMVVQFLGPTSKNL